MTVTELAEVIDELVVARKRSELARLQTKIPVISSTWLDDVRDDDVALVVLAADAFAFNMRLSAVVVEGECHDEHARLVRTARNIEYAMI